ncbi:hypothetical protein [Planctomycetes bacterium K23_9]|uniref:Ferric reductase like transmembrane component n=1 Tax=Stieleria marina TaxID=1930275 RepID=A0A517NTV4_9BACT|nr:hypothetical protein K239x_25100 [Planctomycetes bacterium K23_9]
MQSLSFRNRRVVSLIATACALLIVWACAWLQDARLGSASHFTGFTLLAALFLLIMLGMRRRLPVLPLGSMSSWTQVHLYTGIFSSGVFLMHVPAVIGGGTFEFALSLLFWVVSLSGFYGVYVSRTVPRRLTAVAGQHRFDQVSNTRHRIGQTAEAVLHETKDSAAGKVLEAFYDDYLQSFFAKPPSLAYVLVPTGNRRRRLLGDIKDLDRYLEPDSRETAGRFAALIRRRDDLDYQYALQFRLRAWIAVHATFSIVLTAAAIVHAVIAIRFTW